MSFRVSFIYLSIVMRCSETNSLFPFICLDFLHQLPPEGGTFYTSDTMDSARPYYRKCWPPILYAVTLWLVETGFTCADKEDNRPANMKADESDVSRCHLLLGKC